jgi:hypothetical protein
VHEDEAWHSRPFGGLARGGELLVRALARGHLDPKHGLLEREHEIELELLALAEELELEIPALLAQSAQVREYRGLEDGCLHRGMLHGKGKGESAGMKP